MAAPIAYVRWLAGVSLIQTAESLLRRDADVSSASALIVADAASETVLSLIGADSARKVQRITNHEELIERAQDVLTRKGSAIPHALLAELRSTHTLRNDVVHHGVRTGLADASRSAAVARELLALLPLALTGAVAIPANGGVASAVASVIGVPDVADELVRADAALARDDPAAAARCVGLALGRLLWYTKPTLRTQSRKRLGGPQPQWDDRFGRELIRDVDELRGQVDEIRPWVVAPALGMTPTEFARLNSIGGIYVSYLTTPPMDEVFGDEQATYADARWAVEQIAEAAFRLWETQALVQTEERKFVRKADAQLADATGH